MALYHTHRPQSFDSVVGQTHITKTIQNQILQDKVAHAYLFFGPRGIGKTTTARLLAKAMNCTKRKPESAEPCNTCDSCMEIQRGAALDVIEIDAASHTGVDNVRENIIENAQFKPTKSAHKVFIIDEVHMLSTSAFNALLKTLEEPPSHVLFILATTELHKLPDTIVSRCQRFTFSKIPADILGGHITHIAKEEGVSIDETVVGHIVAKSEGCARDAISLLEQVMATGEKEITAETAAFLLPPSATEEVQALATAFAEHDTAAGLDVLKKLYDQGTSFVHMADDFIAYLRNILIVQAAPETLDSLSLGKKEQEMLTGLAKQFDAHRLVAIIEGAISARNAIKRSPLPQLPLELLLVRHTSPQDATPVASPPSPPPAKPAKNTPKKVLKPKEEQKKSNKEDLPPVPEPPTEPTEAPAQTGEEAPQATHTATSTGISLEEAHKGWPQFIQAIEKDSPALSFILKLAEVVETEGATFVLAVDHTFHRDKLMDKDCIKKLQSLLEPVYSQPVHIRVVLKKEEDKQDQKKELNALAAAFGGEVVG